MENGVGVRLLIREMTMVILWGFYHRWGSILPRDQLLLQVQHPLSSPGN